MKIDRPAPPYIWVRDLFRDIIASTDFSDESKSYWSGRVEVVEDSDDQGYTAGQILFVKVGDGKPWFIRPRQYEQDRRSMFIQPCHVIAAEAEQ